MVDRRGSFPDLPILDELGGELQRAARRAEEADRSVPSRGAARGRPRENRRLRRLSMRPAVAAAALILVLLPAVVAVRLSGEPGRRDVPQGDREAASAVSEQEVALASGTGPEEGWIVTARGRRCVALRVADASPARAACARAQPGVEDRAALEPQARVSALDVAIANGLRDGFVFGLVSETVASVRVTVGDGAQVTVRARRLLDRSSPTDIRARIFVAGVDDRIAPNTPVEVAALDGHGRVIATTQVGRRP